MQYITIKLQNIPIKCYYISLGRTNIEYINNTNVRFLRSEERRVGKECRL